MPRTGQVSNYLNMLVISYNILKTLNAYNSKCHMDLRTSCTQYSYAPGQRHIETCYENHSSKTYFVILI